MKKMLMIFCIFMQCAISNAQQTLDQSSTVANVSGQVMAGTAVGQIFKAGTTGNLTQVDVRLLTLNASGPNNFNLVIYNATATSINTATPISTTSFSNVALGTTSAWHSMVITTPTPIVAGSYYGFAINNASTGVALSYDYGNSNPYADGDYAANFSAYTPLTVYTNFDLSFRTFVSPPPPLTNIGIGTNSPNASAKLDVSSATQGILIPRMTIAQRNAINSPATGLQIYQTDNTPGFYFYNGSAWAAVGGGASTYPNVELSVINNTIQSIPDLAGGTTSSVISFSNTNSSNASLTGGNSWNGSVFTVGATGAGWYQINAQVVGVSSAGAVNTIGVTFFMDKNNAVGTAKTGAIWRSDDNVTGNTSENILRNSRSLNAIVYLAANDNIRFRGISPSTTASANTSADGSTYLNIVRLK